MLRIVLYLLTRMRERGAPAKKTWRRGRRLRATLEIAGAARPPPLAAARRAGQADRLFRRRHPNEQSRRALQSSASIPGESPL